MTTTHISDNFTWTDKDEKDTAKEVISMLNSPKSTLRKSRDGNCDVYEVKLGSESATIVNRKMDEKDQGSWVIFAGKFENKGIGPFVDGSSFDSEITNQKGLRTSLNNKMVMQQQMHHGYTR